MICNYEHSIQTFGLTKVKKKLYSKNYEINEINEINEIKSFIFTPDDFVDSHKIISVLDDEYINIVNITYEKNINNDEIIEKLKNNSNDYKLEKGIIIFVLDDIIDIVNLYTNKKVIIFSNKIKELILANNYDKNIDYICNNIETLIIGNEFNGKINKLPKKLKKLAIGNKFNKDIEENVLPNTLKYLNFGVNFESKVYSLPSELEKLIFKGGSKNVIIKIPTSIIYLESGYFKIVNLENSKNLEYLILVLTLEELKNNKLNKLKNVKNLEIDIYSPYNAVGHKAMNINLLKMESLKYLNVYSYSGFKYNLMLPRNLQYLEIDDYSKFTKIKKMFYMLPNTLKKIKFKCDYSMRRMIKFKNIFKYLPSSVTIVYEDYECNKKYFVNNKMKKKYNLPKSIKRFEISFRLIKKK